MNNKSLSVIIPCYNEQKSVLSFESVFLNYKWLKIQEKYNIEIIFVNDGSSDETLKSTMYLVEKYSFVKFINLEKNQGKDYSIYYGYNQSVMDFVTFIDCDRNYLLYEMDNFLDKMNSNNVVAGNRLGRFFINRWMSFINNLVVSCLFYNFKYIKDVVGQPILISKDFYDKYLKNNIFLFLDKWNFNILIFIKILKFNLKIHWINVITIPREFDEAKGSEGLKNVFLISFKLIKQYFTLKVKLLRNSF